MVRARGREVRCRSPHCGPGTIALRRAAAGRHRQAIVRHENDAGLIALAGLTEPIRSGLTYPVVFGFERAGDVLVEVPVDLPDLPRREPAEGT